MKTIQFFLLICFVSFALSSCERNYDETKVITVDDPSKELPTARVTGQVRNMKNETVANATVHVLHNLNVHDVNTDSNGWYEINLPLDHSTVRLQAESKSYSNANIVIQHLLESELKQDLYLAQAGDMPYDYKNSSIITDSLRTISGFLEYADGNPIVGEVIFLIDFTASDISSYAVIDENGYFSIAVEPFENRTLIVTSSCSNFETIIEDFSVIDEDLDLGTVTVDFPADEQVNFVGLVVDCNTNKPLTFGDISITIGSKTVDSKILAGEYSLVVPNCDGETCYHIIIKSPLLTDGEITLECETIGGITVSENYELCGNPIMYEGSINLVIDGESYTYNTATAQLDGDIWRVEAFDPEALEFIFFLFPASELGEVDVTEFRITDINMNSIYSVTSGQAGLKTNLFENIVNLAGDVSGYVLDVSQNQVSISGGFDIKL